MAGTIPQQAETNYLSNLITNLLSSLVARLFNANHTPVAADTLATYTAIEATFTGYASAALTTWSAPTIDGTGASISTTTQAQFTGTGAGGTGNIYGYFLTDAGETKLYGAELLAGAPLSEPQNVTLEIDVTFSVITRF